MRFIVDTHAFLWYMAGDSSLSAEAKRLIDDRTNERLLSVASLWEMAIKTSQGKLRFDRPFEPFIRDILAANGFRLFHMTVAHSAAVAVLPFPASGHRDPFDRLMVAQCMVEGIPLLSRDGRIDDYSITRIW